MTSAQLFQDARASYARGDVPTAVKLCKTILAKDPTNLNALCLLGGLQMESGDLSAAKGCLEKADSLDPASPFIKGNLGNVCKMLNNFDAARSYYQQALELDGNILGVQLNLASIFVHVDKDAEAADRCYRKAAHLQPNNFDLLYSFGKSLAALKSPSAIEYFQQALRVDPTQTDLYLELAFALLDAKRNSEAADYFRLGLEQSPDNVQLRYYLCIAEGRMPDEALQDEYIRSSVQNLFDHYAEGFDKSLVDDLQYSGPTEIRQYLKENCAGLRFGSCVDLGCGTGLVGEVLRNYCDTITGIDISSKMLSLAEGRRCYDQLRHGELVEILNGSDSRYDLFVATDVINYIGALEKLFSAVAAKANPDALFVITTESYQGTGFVLRDDSIRYAHSRGYVEKVAAMTGCTVSYVKEINLRKSGDSWIAGELFVIKVK